MADRSRRAPRRAVLLLAVFGLAGTLVTGASSPRTFTAAATAPADGFIVYFRPMAAEHDDAARRQDWLDAVGVDAGVRLQPVRRLAVGGDVIAVDRVLDAAAARRLQARLAADPRVARVERDRLLAPAAYADDPETPNLRWHYDAIHAPAAWERATGDGVVVAVIDTGVTAHPDLAPNLVPGYDFISDAFVANDGGGRDGDAADPGDAVAANACPGGNLAAASSWHGTRTAGTIAAVRGNALGMAGVAPQSRVMPLRALGRCGGRVSDIADAIVWASGGLVPGVPANANPAEVINLSVSGAGACDATLQAAIDRATAAGTTVVVAAGNDAALASASTPASCAHALVVGAVDGKLARAPYSNSGPAIDLVAPGGDATHFPVRSLANAGLAAPGTPAYAGYHGTSAAAAHVAGVAALVQSIKPRTPAEVERLLAITARPTAACPGDCGAGLVDADAAVAAATTPTLLVTQVASVTEGNAGLKAVSFTVSLSEAMATPVPFLVSAGDGGGATPGIDFVHADWPAQEFAPGQTSRTFEVMIVGDERGEPKERFHFGAQSTTYDVTSGPGSSTLVLIEDDDIETLRNGVPLNGLTVASLYPERADVYYQFQVPAGASNVQFSITSGSGDLDVYASPGTKPTPTQFFCKIAATSSTRSCIWGNPPAGTWYVLMTSLHTGWSNVALKAQYSGQGLQVRDAQVVEGDAGTKELVFSVELAQASTGTVRFDIAAASGTATAGSDFVAASATGLTIPAGQLARTFSVPVNGDTALEADETLAVNLTNVSGAPVADAQAIGTLRNDDGPRLSVADVSQEEGDTTFVVSLSEPAATAVAFDFATANGTATSGSDYAAQSRRGVVIPAGQLSVPVVVTVYADPYTEEDETFSIDLANVIGAVPGDTHGVATILNNDRAELTIDDVNVWEGDSGTQQMTFRAWVSNASNQPVSFTVQTVGGTATSGVDFVALPPTVVTIPAGSQHAEIVVDIVGDTLDEDRETFELVASDLVGIYPGDVRAQGIISAEVMPVISIADATVTEGASGTRVLSFAVTLSKAVNYPVSYWTWANPHYYDGVGPVRYSADPGSDYVPDFGTRHTIPAGQTGQVYTVTVYGDGVIEPDEYIDVNIDPQWDAEIGDQRARGAILNDDGPALSIGDVSVVEGDSGSKLVTFTASIDAPSTGPVLFDVAASSGTAVVVSDFEPFAATGLRIVAGQLTRTFTVEVKGDLLKEPTETFFVTLSNVVGGRLVDGQATGFIINNDGPLIVVNDIAVSEGNAGTKLMTFTVSLTKVATGPVTYDISSQSGNATAGSDYVAINLTGQVIPQGQLSKTHTITINGDTTVEDTEVVFVNVRQPVGASVWDGQGIGYILNDDGPTLSIPDASTSEGASGTKVMNVTVLLSQVAAVPVTFTLGSANVSATAGSDYVALDSSTVHTIPAGQTSKAFQVTVNGDTAVEQNESFTLTLGNATGATLYDRQAIGTIYNDDGPTLSINNATISEGNSGTKLATFTVALSQASAVPISYSIATSNGTATAGSDYAAKALNNETIPAGQLTKAFTVTINGDTTVEANETFRATLSNISAGATLFAFTGTGTITNDD